MPLALRLFSLFVLLPSLGMAQDSLSRDTYFQITSENDGFQLRSRDVTDRYFTNGLRLDFMSNYWRRWPTRRLLLALPGQGVRQLYSFSVGQEIYTPRRLGLALPSLYPYDRPYAGYLYATWKLVNADAGYGRRLSSGLTLGVMGPISFADRTQMALHELMGQPRPRGWANQLKNDLIISYNARIENRPFGYLTPNFDLIGAVEANIGTLSNYVGIGCQLRLGLFNDYFGSVTGFYKPGQKAVSRRFQLYGFVQSVYRSVLDNALLQGGWLTNRSDEYALPANELEHFYAQADYGVAVVYRGCQVTIAETIRGKEYRTGEQQQWGRFSLCWRIHQE